MENFEMDNLYVEEDITVEPEMDYAVEADSEESGVSKLALMAIGAVATAAIGAAVVGGKKLWGKLKERKALRKPEAKPVAETKEESTDEAADEEIPVEFAEE